MKIILYTISFIFVFSANIFSQIDTTSLSYYPLSNGDYWEYVERNEDNIGWPPYISIEYFSQKVIDDTLMPIGKTFKIIERNWLGSFQPPSYIFERVDTISCNVYRYDTYSQTEFLIDSLKSQAGDSCNAGRFGFDTGMLKNYCTAFFVDTIFFSLPVLTKEFSEPNLFFPATYRLSSGIGLTQIDIQHCFGTFTSRLLYAVIDSVEYGNPVNIVQNQNEPILNEFYLYQNYPNPFNSTTIIPFDLPQISKVEITIYDIAGRKIKTLFSGEMDRGAHNITWDGNNQSGQQVASGVYIYTLKATALNNSSEAFNGSSKLLLLR